MSRQVIEQITARPASDGAGVKLLRVFGGHRPERFDPFLLMDEFGSEEASDYIAGFPPHPHRGFETITYMLQGKMEHKDHMGNVGLLNDSDVQWMTAGKGVIHSEMPKQTEGKMRGMQVWLNLPAKNKLTPAKYNDVSGQDIPSFNIDGSIIKAIAGEAEFNGQRVSGYFDVPDTEALYFDVHIGAEKSVSVNVPNTHNALAYVYDGKVQFGEKKTPGPAQTVNRFSNEGTIEINNPGAETARIILLAGIPLKEPIAQHGPFVMNTMEEINQAIVDYQKGVLTD